MLADLANAQKTEEDGKASSRHADVKAVSAFDVLSSDLDANLDASTRAGSSPFLSGFGPAIHRVAGDWNRVSDDDRCNVFCLRRSVVTTSEWRDHWLLKTAEIRAFGRSRQRSGQGQTCDARGGEDTAGPTWQGCFAEVIGIRQRTCRR